MGLKGGAGAHRYGCLVERAGLNMQGKAEEKGRKGSTLLGRGRVCRGREWKAGQGEKGIKWLCPAWER